MGRGLVPFARGTEEPMRRRSADAVRVGVAIVVLLLAAGNSGHDSTLLLDVFQFFNDLPGGMRPAFVLLYDVVGLWPVLLLLGALVARRWRLARDLLVAALIGWLLSRGLGLVLESGFHGLRAVVRLHRTPTFPNVRFAVVVAVIVTAGPFLTRGARRAGWVFAVLLLPTELYLGVALPKSLIAALALGWGVGALVHLVFGSPGGRPTLDQVQQALADLGCPAEGLTLAPEQPSQHSLVLAQAAAGPVVIKVLGRDETDARLITKAWRLVYLKDSGPTLFLTRAQEVQHNAYISLLARDAGVRVPQVVAAGMGGPGAALLVERELQGAALADLPDPEDALLEQVWQQVRLLHSARIAHRSLHTRHVRITPDGPALGSLDSAVTIASPDALGADVAELLATTAVLVGHERAVRAAVTVLGAEAVAAALPLLQPAALSRPGRALAGAGEGSVGAHLERLRAEFTASTGSPEVALEQLQRVRPAGLLFAVGTLVGVGALLSSVGDPAVLGHAVRRADPALLALAASLSLLTMVAYAISLEGATHRTLPFWPNVKLQFAGAFSNLALPLGSQALQVRFLQRQGADAATAVAGGGVISVAATLATQATLLPIALYASPQRIDTRDIPRGAIENVLAAGTAALLLSSLLLFAVPPLRRRFSRPVLRGARSLVSVLRSPRQVTLLLVGNVAASVLPALSLTACLAAVGDFPSVWALLAITVGVTLVASLVPFPGGSTAVTGVGMAGAVAGLGVPQSRAVAAVLMYQVITTVLPSLPGWLSLRSLMAAEEL